VRILPLWSTVKTKEYGLFARFELHTFQSIEPWWLRGLIERKNSAFLILKRKRKRVQTPSPATYERIREFVHMAKVAKFKSESKSAVGSNLVSP
jgi:hypothetical protein